MVCCSVVIMGNPKDIHWATTCRVGGLSKLILTRDISALKGLIIGDISDTSYKSIKITTY